MEHYSYKGGYDICVSRHKKTWLGLYINSYTPKELTTSSLKQYSDCAMHHVCQQWFIGLDQSGKYACLTVMVKTYILETGHC